MKKVGYVLAYYEPDYIRTRALVNALKHIPKVELHTAINSNRSILRYLQTAYRLVVMRIRQHPDLYLFGFRSHESYWLFRALTFPKPVIFDEFINMHTALTKEKKKIKESSLVAKLARAYVRMIHKSARKILTDTQLHAQSSSRTYGTPKNKYGIIYVGTDESVFFPQRKLSKSRSKGKLEVFFYGNIQALHGIDVILEAAKILRQDGIHFTIIGGKGSPATIKSIRSKIKLDGLDNVSYTEWADFSSLPGLIGVSDVCLGGPFGATEQAKSVITGKTFQFLAMAKPTVVGDIDEDAGFVDRQNCLIVKQGSADALARKLRWAVDHKQELPSIGTAGYDLYKSRFSSEALSHALADIINSAD